MAQPSPPVQNLFTKPLSAPVSSPPTSATPITAPVPRPSPAVPYRCWADRKRLGKFNGTGQTSILVGLMNFSLTPSDLDKDQGSYTLKCWGCVSADLPPAHELFHIIQIQTVLASLQWGLGYGRLSTVKLLSFDWLKKFSGRAEWSVVRHCISVWYKSECRII